MLNGFVNVPRIRVGIQLHKIATERVLPNTFRVVASS